ncbi:MAG: hypothetical protein POG24_09100 [Acidocella sp.]|nr:hypothetical protein [Acidocella sp.]
MATVREQILEKMVAVLNAGAIGAPVYRSRTDPVSRNQSPAVIISPVTDQATLVSIEFFEWSLTVHVVLYVRGPAPDVLADPIVAAIHAALMADMTLGNLVETIEPVSTHFEFSDTDVCVATGEFKISYRTSQQDLTR